MVFDLMVKNILLISTDRKIAIDPVLIGLRLVETKIPPYSLPLVLIPPLASGGEVVNSILLSHLTAVGPRGKEKEKKVELVQFGYLYSGKVQITC